MAHITFLLWDATNITHIAKHGVAPAEVEQAVLLSPTVGPLNANVPNRPGRLYVIGRTTTGRDLIVFLDKPTTNGTSYVLSARKLSPREHKQHLTEEGSS